MNIGRCVMAWRGKGGVLSSLPRELTPSPSRGGLWRGWVSPPTCADSNASYQIGSGTKYIATRRRCFAGGWYLPAPCAASRMFVSAEAYHCRTLGAVGTQKTGVCRQNGKMTVERARGYKE